MCVWRQDGPVSVCSAPGVSALARRLHFFYGTLCSVNFSVKRKDVRPQEDGSAIVRWLVFTSCHRSGKPAETLLVLDTLSRYREHSPKLLFRLHASFFFFPLVLSGSERNLQVYIQVYPKLKVASITATRGHFPLQMNCQWERLEKPLEGKRKPIFLSTLPQRQSLWVTDSFAGFCGRMFMQMPLLLWAEIAIRWQAKTNWVENSATRKREAEEQQVISIHTSYTAKKSGLDKNLPCLTRKDMWEFVCACVCVYVSLWVCEHLIPITINCKWVCHMLFLFILRGFIQALAMDVSSHLVLFFFTCIAAIWK